MSLWYCAKINEISLLPAYTAFYYNYKYFVFKKNGKRVLLEYIGEL